MRRHLSILVALCSLLGLPAVGNAQSVYRCGNVYSNKPAEGCVLIPGGKITVVQPKPTDCPLPPAKPGQEWLNETSTPVSVVECRSLTDKARNQGKPLTVRQLEQVRADYARDRNYSPDTIWTAISRASMMKKVDCMIASSDIKMCTCLAEALPVDLSYLQYVILVTVPKQSDVSQIDWKPFDLDRLFVDVRSVRDMCVAREETTIAMPEHRQKN